MKILRKTIKWLVDWDEKGNFVEMETTEDGKEFIYVKPLTRPMGLVFYLPPKPFELLYDGGSK
jgi:hypothetical protein